MLRALFGFFVSLPQRRREVKVIGPQLLRSGTSVAAHSREASRARSNAEFCSKIDGLLQEADESHLWLELLRDGCGCQTDCSIECNELLQEPESAEIAPRQTNELINVFTSMVSKTRRTL